MEIIYVIGASQAFFLSILAFNKNNKTDGDRILAVWLLFIGLHLLDYYINRTGIAYEHPHLLGLGACFPLLQGPFMYVYILVMISRNNKFRPVYLLHGIPFLAFSIWFLFDFYFLNGTEKINYIHMQANNPSLVIILVNIFILLLGPIYIVLSLLRLRKHHREIEDSFSYTEGINLNWLQYVLGGLGFIWFMVLLTNILVKIPVITDTFSEDIIYLTVAVSVFFLGYFGIKQKAIYNTDDNMADKKRASKMAGVEDRKMDNKDLEFKKAREAANFRELLDYFEREKPYLDNRLSLKDVAESLGIPPNQLSHIINGQAGKNFFDFVNSYRVEEFKSKASHPDYRIYTLVSIAFESGFNSKATFNRVFRNYTGQTPSDYFHSVNRY